MKYVQKDVSAGSANVKRELWPQLNIVEGPNPDFGKKADEPQTCGCVMVGNTLKPATVKLESLNIMDFESLGEAVQNTSEAEVLRLFNVQYKTTMMNKCRQKWTGEVSDTELEARAIQLMFKDPQWQAAASAAAAQQDGGQAFNDLKEKAKEALRQQDAAQSLAAAQQAAQLAAQQPAVPQQAVPTQAPVQPVPQA